MNKTSTIEEQTSSVEEVEEIEDEDEPVEELISAKECDEMLRKIIHHGMVNGLSDMVESVSKTHEKHQKDTIMKKAISAKQSSLFTFFKRL